MDTEQFKLVLFACLQQDIDKLIEFKNNGIDLHFDNDYFFRYSATGGYLKSTQYLFEQGADIHAYHDSFLLTLKLNNNLKQGKSYHQLKKI